MSHMSSSSIEQPIPAPARNEHVIMGNQSFVSTLGRAVAGELYKIRRRKMPKVLGTIAVVTIILASIFTSYFPTDKATLQNAFFTSITVTNFIGTLLLIILAGAVVGGDYSHGCIRLLLSRGPSRLQFLLAKLGAMLICMFIMLATLIVISLITWTLVSLIERQPIVLEPLTGAQILHTLLYMLTTALSLFTYSLLAISLSSWGKATAAGVTSVLTWWFLEGGIITLLSIVGSRLDNAFGTFLQAIPDYLIGNNLAALHANQEDYLTGQTHASLSDLHAGIVILVYLIVFTGITWWDLQKRDITN